MKSCPFDQIIDAVTEGRCDAGLLIHEGQLFYHNLGLHKVLDLGEWWHEYTGGLPLPMGGNAIRQDLGDETIREVSELLKESIQYSLDNREDALEYAMQFARDMDPALADRFVAMWVNRIDARLQRARPGSCPPLAHRRLRARNHSSCGRNPVRRLRCLPSQKQTSLRVVSCFAVFLCGFAPWREQTRFERDVSRKGAKTQSFAKSE